MKSSQTTSTDERTGLNPAFWSRVVGRAGRGAVQCGAVQCWHGWRWQGCVGWGEGGLAGGEDWIRVRVRVVHVTKYL